MTFVSFKVSKAATKTPRIGSLLQDRAWNLDLSSGPPGESPARIENRLYQTHIVSEEEEST